MLANVPNIEIKCRTITHGFQNYFYLNQMFVLLATNKELFDCTSMVWGDKLREYTTTLIWIPCSKSYRGFFRILEDIRKINWLRIAM